MMLSKKNKAVFQSNLEVNFFVVDFALQKVTRMIGELMPLHMQY